jgi:hypothetical protein
VKKILLLLLALALPITLRAAESTDASDKATITGLENDWLKAFVEKTRPECLACQSRLLADRFTRQPRHSPEPHHRFEIGVYTVESMHADDIQVRVVGDWAIVLGLETEKSQTNGQDSSGQFRFLDTWQKRDGHWLCVASAAIQVKPEKQ